MTTAQAIAMADTLHPNTYEEALKLGWLTALDGMIYREVLLWHEDAPAPPTVYTTAEAALLVGPPYCGLYVDYILAMMDLHDAEFERYTNAMIRFNSAYSAFADDYNRTHTPRRSTGVHF